MGQGDPVAGTGQTVGLLGGSFDPPHRGHVHITQVALTRLRLDWVWWLVSPGNPLKPDRPAALDRRVRAARDLVRHPRVRMTGIEARLGTRFTADTLSALARRYPHVRFVWLMGADNLAGFHRWDQWRRIMATTPVAVLARPDGQIAAGLSPAARAFSRYRLPAAAAPALIKRPSPAWVLVTGPMVEASSTALRNQGIWTR